MEERFEGIRFMERYLDTQKVGIFGILGNLFLLIIKALVAFVSSSQSMIADTVNSASDIFASLMTTIGSRIANVPGDEDHNFGHGKAEYLFSLFISLSMIALSFKLLWDSFFSILNKNVVVFSFSLLIVCIVTILVKFFLYIYSKKIYKKHRNILVESNMCDHRNDCIITIFTLISILFSYYGIYWVDGVIGFLISMWIFYTGIQIFFESYHVLMDISLSSERRDFLKSLVLKDKMIKKIDEIYSVPVGYRYIVVLTIYVDGRMTTEKSHKIADQLEEKIVKNMDIIQKAIIHVNPV